MILTPDGLIEYVEAQELAAINNEGPVIVWAPDEQAYWLTSVIVESDTETRAVIRVTGNRMANPTPIRRGVSAQRFTGMRTVFKLPIGSPVPIIRYRKEFK